MCNPINSTRQALGLDLAADPVVLEALQQTRDSGQMRISPLIPLERESIIEYGFAARLAVYNKADTNETEAEDEEEDAPPDTPEQRQQLLRGFAAGFSILADIVEDALQNLSPSGIDIVFHDVSAPEKTLSIPACLQDTSCKIRPSHPGGQRVPETLGVRPDYQCQRPPVGSPVHSVPGFFQPDPWSGWVTLAGGLPFTALLAIYLSTLVGRTAKVKRLVPSVRYNWSRSTRA